MMAVQDDIFGRFLESSRFNGALAGVGFVWKMVDTQETEVAMAEYWDVYDANEKKTGRTMKRGTPADGDYMLCVNVYLYTPDGKFLMQKRSEKKQSHPGIWDVTGGAVQAGESSIEGAIRETEEEV